jgi:hypothetical protein
VGRPNRFYSNHRVQPRPFCQRQQGLQVGHDPDPSADQASVGVIDASKKFSASRQGRLCSICFTAQEMGTHNLKGVTAPVQVYHMLGESTAQSCLDIASPICSAALPAPPGALSAPEPGPTTAVALQMAKGQAAPEVEYAYTRAHVLCQQMGKTPQLVPVLFGLWRFYVARPQLHTARGRGNLAAPGATCPRPGAGGPRPLCPGGDVVMAGHVARSPLTPGGRYRPLHARPAPYASVPYWPRSRGGLPHRYRHDPLVTGVSSTSPGPPPRGPGVGARAVTAL